MLVRIVRRLTPEEVKQSIKKFEHKYNMNFDEFEERFLEERLNKRTAETYFEWAALMDAYRGYIEEGELDYTVEELRTLTPKDMAVITPKRLELLYTLAHLRVESINNLAHKVHRDVKNIYQDLQILKKLGFVTLKRIGKRNIVPETLVEEISFLIH
ncbi:MAG: hypothetical protein U9O89_08185 [Thermoproteota archaeon]|nr:hypothetical protein [Thermoproteota archaeon]